MAIADDLEQAAFERQIEADQLAAKEAKDNAAELAGLAALLVAELRKAAPNERAGLARQLRRLDALLREVDPELTKVYRRMRTRNQALLVKLAEAEGDHVIQTVGTAAGASLLWKRLTAKKAEAIIEVMDIEGEPLVEWWSRQRVNVKRDFRRQMRAGLSAGEDLPTLVARVQGSSAQRGRGGLMRVARRHAETLVNTSMHAARQEARLAVYQAHPEVVQHVQAMNEDPVSDICQSRAGRVWRLQDAPAAPPWHPNCKSSLIPVLRPLSRMDRRKLPPKLRDELGALSKSKRVGLDGKPAKGLTPQQIFRNMPREQQLKRLGKGRLELFEAGKLNFRQLVDQTGRPRTLEELEALVDG